MHEHITVKAVVQNSVGGCGKKSGKVESYSERVGHESAKMSKSVELNIEGAGIQPFWSSLVRILAAYNCSSSE